LGAGTTDGTDEEEEDEKYKKLIGKSMARIIN
jgi:hypothetical protein